MSTELDLLAWSALLAFLLIFAAAAAKRTQEPKGWGAGARDAAVPEYTGLAGRLNRASNNMLETFPIFAALVLVAHLAGREGGLTMWGAELYFWARLIYVPLYAAGTPYLRSVVWFVSIIGIVLLLIATL